jgi:hypothetical protein
VLLLHALCSSMLLLPLLLLVVYDYAQSIEELLIEAQVPAHIQQQDVCVKFELTSLLVVVGRQRVIDGCLAGRILPAHSSWKLGECTLGQGPGLGGQCGGGEAADMRWGSRQQASQTDGVLAPSGSGSGSSSG